VRSTVW